MGQKSESTRSGPSAHEGLHNPLSRGGGRGGFVTSGSRSWPLGASPGSPLPGSSIHQGDRLDRSLPLLSAARHQKCAGGPARSGKASVKRRKRNAERLSQRDIPCVIACHRMTQLPYSVCKRIERKQLQIEPLQIRVRGARLGGCDSLLQLQTAKHVRCFNLYQFGCVKKPAGQNLLGPNAVWSRIDERRNQHRRIDDRTHFRSASRCCRICLEGTRLWVVLFLLRTCSSHALIDGRDAIRSSSERRNSCMDLPCSAARSASSSRTLSGTSRIVI